MNNQFEIEILDDGIIKITTGKFSPAIHVSADGFLVALEKILNPEKKDIKPKQGFHVHNHDHERGHDHKH